MPFKSDNPEEPCYTLIGLASDCNSFFYTIESILRMTTCHTVQIVITMLRRLGRHSQEME